MKRALRKHRTASPETASPRRYDLRRLLRLLGIAGCVAMLGGVIAGLIGYIYLVARLPDVTALDTYTPSVVSK